MENTEQVEKTTEKINFSGLQGYFKEKGWGKFTRAKSTQEKWKEFLIIYDERIEKYFPEVEELRDRRKNWFNHNCKKGQEKERSLEQMQRKRIQQQLKGTIQNGKELIQKNLKRSKKEIMRKML